MAAFGLGLIGDAGAVDVLVGALDDPAPPVQGRAAQALARLGADSAAPAIGAMVRRHVTSAYDLDPDDMTYPQGASVEAFRLGLYALGELQAFEPLAEAVLGEDARPILWWWPVAYALGRTGDERALPALVTLAGVRGSVGPALAAEGLGRLADPDGTEALADLLSLERRGRAVVLSALRALGEMDDPRAAEELDRFVRIAGLDRQLRRAAVDALANHASRASIEVFVELLGHPWPPLRAASVRALSRADPERFLLVLSGLGADPDWRVRAAAAEGLGHAGPEAARATLEAMLNDDDQRVLPAVLDALAAGEPTETASLLLDRLETPDVVVRATAARLLGELRPPDAEAALAAAYEAAGPDASFLGPCGDRRCAGRVRRRCGAGDARRRAGGPGLAGSRPRGGASRTPESGVGSRGGDSAGAGAATRRPRRTAPDESAGIAARLHRDGPRHHRDRARRAGRALDRGELHHSRTPGLLRRVDVLPGRTGAKRRTAGTPGATTREEPGSRSATSRTSYRFSGAR